MSELIPVAVVILALVAAGSIVYVAWELTSKEIHEVLERSLGHGAAEGGPDGSSSAGTGATNGSEEPGPGEPQVPGTSGPPRKL